MKKIIIRKRGDTGSPVLVSVIRALFPECKVEVFSEGRPARRDSLPVGRPSKDIKKEERP